MSGGMSSLMNGLQTAIGVGATAMGQPQIGLPLAMQGASGLAGGGSGGLPAGLGSFAGGTGALGSLGNALGLSNTGGFSAPTPGQLSQLPSWLNPSQVAGVSNNQAPTASQPSPLGQLGQTAQAVSPAAGAIMKGMGLGQQPQQTQPTPQPQQPPMQSAAKPNPRGPLTIPQQPTPPTSAGVMAGGGGQGAAGGMPTAAGVTAGANQNNPLRQVLAMMGMGQYA